MYPLTLLIISKLAAYDRQQEASSVKDEGIMVQISQGVVMVQEFFFNLKTIIYRGGGTTPETTKI